MCQSQIRLKIQRTSRTTQYLTQTLRCTQYNSSDYPPPRCHERNSRNPLTLSSAHPHVQFRYCICITRAPCRSSKLTDLTILASAVKCRTWAAMPVRPSVTPDIMSNRQRGADLLGKSCQLELEHGSDSGAKLKFARSRHSTKTVAQ